MQLRGKRFSARRFLLLTLILQTPVFALASGVSIHQHDAVVWSQNLIINGNAGAGFDAAGTLLVNGSPVPFTLALPADTFSVPIHIGEGTSVIVARVDSGGVPVYSDTLRLTLGYNVRPELYAYPTVAGRTVQLHGSMVTNDDSSSLAFSWSADPANPAVLAVNNALDSLASCTVPSGAPPGEYYFNLVAFSSHGDTCRARTLVTIDSSAIVPFDIRTDHARWIDSAIVYGVDPSIFVENGHFSDITAKIPELAQLGVTALWIQPVFATYGGGQGYDVIDYFAIRSDLGTEADLRTLVQTAHANGLKVLLDFVPNHTSIHHPYAQDAIQYGPTSHYYDFYQRMPDTAPYSSNEHSRVAGNMNFIYYFWTDLENLNYDNPEVQRMIIEAGRYWIELLDIDGYRVDAVWAVNARNPAFMQQWRLALKRLKPEALLLAEDKASVGLSDPSGRPSPFDGRFDAAYDWTSEMSWVSHWVWQSYYSASSNPTIFNNTTESQRGTALKNSLTNNGAGYTPGAIVFRFMENNDTFRFLATHDLPRTKMVAAMLFSLNGIPLLFNGQEIGASTHPYNAFMIFNASASIRSQDSYGLFPYYQQLIALRKRFTSLMSPNFQQITVVPSASEFAYRRWSGGQNIFTCINMASASASATLSILTGQLSLDTSRTYYLTDLISGQYISGTPGSLSSIGITMPGYSTRMFVLADSVVNVTGVQEAVTASLPGVFALSQNYPNPFNPSTTIRFDIPQRGNVSLKVFDLLGREVSTLVAEELNPGSYEVHFDGTRLATGVYFYRLQTDNQSIVRKMLLMK